MEWGSHRPGLETEDEMLQSPHQLADEHLARPNLNNQLSSVRPKFLHFYQISVLYSHKIQVCHFNKPLGIKWTRSPCASIIWPLRSMQPQPQSVVKVVPSS